jgi:hypothetical protein
MWLEEVEKLSKKQLRVMINRSFELADEPGQDRGPLYEKAAFYMRELEHRRDSWVSIRDFILEVVVIALIGWEIWIGYRAEHQQQTNFEEQKQVFDNLEKSSGATAGSLIAAQQVLQNMNVAMQKQLGLFYDVSINMVIDENKKDMVFINNGRTNISIWGIRAKGELPVTIKEGRVITPGGGYQMDVTADFDLITKRFLKPADGGLEFELYVKNERGEEFVQYGFLGIHWQNDVRQMVIQTRGIEPERWSKNPELKNAFSKATR